MDCISQTIQSAAQCQLRNDINWLINRTLWPNGSACWKKNGMVLTVKTAGYMDIRCLSNICIGCDDIIGDMCVPRSLIRCIRVPSSWPLRWVSSVIVPTGSCMWVWIPSSVRVRIPLAAISSIGVMRVASLSISQIGVECWASAMCILRTRYLMYVWARIQFATGCETCTSACTSSSNCCRSNARLPSQRATCRLAMPCCRWIGYGWLPAIALGISGIVCSTVAWVVRNWKRRMSSITAACFRRYFPATFRGFWTGAQGMWRILSSAAMLSKIIAGRLCSKWGFFAKCILIVLAGIIAWIICWLPRIIGWMAASPIKTVVICVWWSGSVRLLPRIAWCMAGSASAFRFSKAEEASSARWFGSATSGRSATTSSAGPSTFRHFQQYQETVYCN